MISRLIAITAATLGWTLFVLAYVWPAAALLVGVLGELRPPVGGFTFSSRQLGLLWRSVWLSGAATMAAMLLSLPAAYVVGQAGRLTRRPWLPGVLGAAVLCPPMVYAFGWERVLPPSFPAYVRCLGVWALWAWPISAALLGTGWARMGKQAYEAALLEVSPATAFVRVVVPCLRRYGALSAILLFLLFFGDYGVPHACGLLVYATELLVWASSSRHVMDTLWPALLPLAVTAGTLAMALPVWQAEDPAGADLAAAAEGVGPSPVAIILMLATLAASWLVPMAALVAKLDSPAVVTEALHVYGGELAWSLSTSVVAGLVAVVMGFGVALSGARWRTLALIWSVLLFALPGALVGEALIAAYNHAAAGWLFDHWPIVVLGHVSRFGWIGLAAATILTSRTASALVDQAQTDGAGRASLWRHVFLPLGWPTMLACIGAVTVLALAEVPTTTLTRVPTFAPIAHVIIEKFHRFEDGMLISLSLCLVAAALPAALPLWAAAKRWRQA